MSLRRYSLRSLRQRPGRALLTITSIIIGVGAIVSFSVTTQTTRGAYKQMFSLVTGRTSLEVATDGPGGLDPALEQKVAAIEGVEVAVPTLQRLSIIYANKNKARLQLLGIDPARDPLVRDYRITAGRGLQDDDELLLDRPFAERLQVEVDQSVKLLSRRGLKSLKVVGFIESRGGAALKQAGTMLVTLKKAQSLFGVKDRIDRLQVVVKDGTDVDAVQRAIAVELPDGVEVRKPNTSSQLMEETLRSSEHGLRLASLFSMLSASFIILNTFLMAVSERRRQLAILRAIGATSSQIMRAVMGESLVLGVIGTALGIAGGVGLAKVLNRIFNYAMQVELPSAQLSPSALAIAIVCGLGMALLGAFVPARMASRISPLEGLDRVNRADLQGAPWFYAFVGFVLTSVSTVLIVMALRGQVSIMVPTYVSVFLLVGIVMLSSLVLDPLCRVVAASISPFTKVLGRLALTQVLRHRARSTLTSGVLFVAASTGVGIAYAILDNVQDVRDWYQQALQGDFFIRAMMPDMATGMAADLPEELGDEIRQIPHLRSITAGAMLEARVGETTVIVVARELLPNQPMPLDLVVGDPQHVRQEFLNGNVVVGSVLSTRLGLKVGDTLKVETGQGTFDLPICGVTNDYMVGGYSAYINMAKVDELFGAHGIDGYAIRVDPANRAEAQQALQAICDKHGVLLHSFTDVANQIEVIISGIVASLWLLIVLGFVVGAFGVINTIAMNVLEQTRELGLLRIVAMTRQQVRRTILTQAVIMAGVGLVPGILGGLLVAYVLNAAASASTGHAIDFGYHPGLLAITFASSMTLIVVAAWFPAQRAARLDAVRALHYE